MLNSKFQADNNSHRPSKDIMILWSTTDCIYDDDPVTPGCVADVLPRCDKACPETSMQCQTSPLTHSSEHIPVGEWHNRIVISADECRL